MNLVAFMYLWLFSGNPELSADKGYFQPLSIQSMDTAALIKEDLKVYFGVSGIPAVRSRKSCNCGCDIIKENYPAGEFRFEWYDFCDSQVFEWWGVEDEKHLQDSLMEDIVDLLHGTGYRKLVLPANREMKRRNSRKYIYGPDDLTFLEVTLKKNKILHLKLSIATY